ncbi:hypothetical protein HBI46_082860 [Parastagonospora nodorum]|nr:hypothetical protein HBI46_082860 [Parastagonospora nodorum]
MASNSRYANLSEAPLEVMAELRGLSPDGDKDTLVQLLVAQDIEISAAGVTEDEAAEPNDKTWNSDVEAAEATNGADDYEAWEVVGKKTLKRAAAKPEIRVPKNVEGIQDTSNAEHMEEIEIEPVVVGRKDEAVPVTEVVDIEVTEDLQDASTTEEPMAVDAKVTEAIHDVPTDNVFQSEVDIPVGEVSKKKRRRGRKGGKKVNKNKATEYKDAASKEIKEDSMDFEAVHEVDDAGTVSKAPSTASTVVEEASSAALTVFEDNEAVHNETDSDLVESEATQDIAADHSGDDAESAVELSSTAPTVAEEQSPELEKTNEVDDKSVEDIQASSSHEVKFRQITKARAVPASPNQFDVLSVEEDNFIKLETIEAAIDLAVDLANDSTPRKSRKRGKKGGKKVQKATAKKVQPKQFMHVACAAALVGMVGVAVGVLVMLVMFV